MLPVSEEDSWTLLEEYKEATKTFEDFKKKVIDLYPSCSADRKFTNDDLDRLIGQAIRNPIKDLDGLSTFYREYLKITTFMRDKNRLGEAEQSRTFKRGLPEALWNRIDARLQIKYPDHNRENHYPLDDIYNAAKFVLQGSSVSYDTGRSTDSSVKSEELSLMLEALTKTFSQTLTQTLAPVLQLAQSQAPAIANNIAGGLVS
ncbi:hypothetical protein NLI96_g13170 [Meripilus lineatus]|uniref:Uncharacterized protein n=1 Tax=Meripilus lineatus TaxID=2056292 RepID=A0AAD5Y7J3_9APHY|nr:hypothetical protein NLI96_g13170 [Physisporinus lineatus]